MPTARWVPWAVAVAALALVGWPAYRQISSPHTWRSSLGPSSTSARPLAVWDQPRFALSKAWRAPDQQFAFAGLRKNSGFLIFEKKIRVLSRDGGLEVTDCRTPAAKHPD